MLICLICSAWAHFFINLHPRMREPGTLEEKFWPKCIFIRLWHVENKNKNTALMNCWRDLEEILASNLEEILDLILPYSDVSHVMLNNSKKNDGNAWKIKANQGVVLGLKKFLLIQSKKYHVSCSNVNIVLWKVSIWVLDPSFIYPDSWFINLLVLLYIATGEDMGRS